MYTTKFEFESFETQFCFSSSPDVVPIVFISVEKSFENKKFAFFCHFLVRFSPVFCKYLGLEWIVFKTVKNSFLLLLAIHQVSDTHI